MPTLLVGGWQDLFLEQTVAQYRALADRGVDVGLTVGPWTHLAIGTRGAATVARETLAWLDEHLAGATGRTRRAPVRVARTGDRRWWELPEWPPPTTPRQWRLEADGRLEDAADDATGSPAAATATDGADLPEPSTAPAAPLRRPAPARPSWAPLLRPPPRPAARERQRVLAEFRYDPADPTPAMGGRLLTPDAGVRDNRRLAARPDVVTFTTPPLERELVIAGAARVEVDHVADPPYADLFVRLCDVAPNGRAHNIADGMRRRQPATGPLTVELDPCFHRVAPGHRLALLVAGGAHPRFLRNNGTGEPPADAVGLVPVIHRIEGGTLTLPLTDDHKLFPRAG